MSFRGKPQDAPAPSSSGRPEQRQARNIVTVVAAAAAIIVTSGPARAQTVGEGSAQVATGSAVSAQNRGAEVLSGYVTDPDDAAIPGALLTLTSSSSGKAYIAHSGPDGGYSLRGVPSGTYSLTVTSPSFATYVKLALRISAARPLTLNPKLAIENAQQVVKVTTTQNQVSVDPDANASATVLKGKALDALSDDPDELQSELTALAGPAAGPNGGQIYIDGFTGGQLPPKSSIREIRINQNPFSAEFDRAGYGRIEIFTKPGTDKLHGSLQVNGLDKAFNTGSPFILPGTPQPPYHTILSFGSLTGPISKTASFSVSGSYRNIENNTVVDPSAIFATAQTSGTICYPGQTGCGIYTLGPNGYSFANSAPQLRWDISPRVDLALGKNNTLTVRVHYEHSTSQNAGIGGDTLFSTGTNSSDAESTLQISDTQILSPRVINETRFEYQRPTSTTTPISQTAAIVVQGAFSGGGSPTGLVQDKDTHIEFQNYTSVALEKHFLRLGGRLRIDTDRSTVTANPNGTFNYSSIQGYVSGNLRSYSLTVNPHPTVSATRADLGVYAEDDWKLRPNLTFSYGLRYETQNFIHDQADFAPRLSVAYGVSKKTVLRAGFGLFYDRFDLTDQLTTLRDNGQNQQSFYIASSGQTGASTIDPACNPVDPAACAPLLTSSAGNLTVRQIAPNLRAPYNIQANIGFDQQLFSSTTLSLNYQHIRGVHGLNSDVPNYATAAGTLADPIVYQYQSNGIYNQNQLIAHVSYNGKHGTLGGYYVLNFANSDFSGANSFASVPNDLTADYGRASFDRRNRVFVFGSFTLPHLITLSPFLFASSGTPYNVTSGTDLYHDNVYNARAVLVSSGTPAITNGYVKTIGGCGTFATPGTPGSLGLVPEDYCTGPANFTVNLRLAKTFGLGRLRAEPASATGQGNGGPGGDHHGRGGGPGGPGGPGHIGRGGGGSGASSGHLYNLTLGAQAQNLFNVADRTAPVGTLSSPVFGTSTQLAGTLFTTDSAVRRILLQASFSF